MFPWLREHRMAAGLVVLLLTLATVSLLGVGNDGTPWRWGADAGSPRPVDREVQRGVLLVVLLPVGGLITASFRRVGIRTFGSFTPTLIALGLVGSPWTVWALVFVVSVATAMTGRLLVRRLRVNRRARLSLVIMILAATTVAVASASARMGLGAPAGGVLLPMVALTLMVEHFLYQVETRGLTDALERLGSTLLVALVSFGVFSAIMLEDLAVQYPGIVFVVAAALILVGLPAPRPGGLGANEVAEQDAEDEAERKAEEAAEAEAEEGDAVPLERPS